jgi:hypothetical protein
VKVSPLKRTIAGRAPAKRRLLHCVTANPTTAAGRARSLDLDERRWSALRLALPEHRDPRAADHTFLLLARPAATGRHEVAYLLAHRVR